MNTEHGGNVWACAQRLGCTPEDICDFSANINPVGPPSWLRGVISRALSQVMQYPDPRAHQLCERAAQAFGLTAAEVLAGNGASELLYLLPRLAVSQGITRAFLPAPCYTDYARACKAAGLRVEFFPLHAEQNFFLDYAELQKALQHPALVMVGHPGNPAGQILDGSSMLALMHACPESLFVLDEAFADFIPDCFRFAPLRAPNALVVHSLTKLYAIPGLRLGLLYGPQALCASLHNLLPDWNVNGLAQAVGLRALDDAAYIREAQQNIVPLREALARDLRALGLTVFPGQANYLLCRLRAGGDAGILQHKLDAARILVRNCATYQGLDARYFRVAVRREEENARLVSALESALGKKISARIHPQKKKRVPAIMLQGLSSNAGKSVLTAALCRIFHQDGLRVAPFKAQNMSLNSFVTRDGLEMGRAQVLQAQACGLEPDVRMNPVLLKPNSDVGSQVIVLGKAVGSMPAREYFRYKSKIFGTICQTYDALSCDRDVMVLEGAGSPAEVNLKAHDVVNMRMARYAGARVLLVGDIDRGGVFASFIGTMEVFEQWERELVAGFLVNRFRGDESLLLPALSMTRAHTGIKTLGVIPYIPVLGLPDEDSVSFKEAVQVPGCVQKDVRIAVVDLPHVSNITDCDALSLEPDVTVCRVRKPEDLAHADAIIVPGSRNVFADLHFLHQSGLAEALLRSRVERIGICGGLQMFGQVLEDPLRVEGAGKTAKPLGLLPLRTVMAEDKTLAQVRGVFAPDGSAVYGYEIHHGQTNVLGVQIQAVFFAEAGDILGWGTPDGLVWGTYLHGLFDADIFRRRFLDRLRLRKGLPALEKIQLAYNLDPALNRLADIVRSCLNMQHVYNLLE